MMTFLNKTTDIDVDETLSEQTQDSSVQSVNEDSQPSTSNQQPRLINNQQPTTRQENKIKTKKRANLEFEAELLQYLKTSELDIQNDDLAFYKSIQPTLNGFTSYQKLMFRTQVLNLLMEMTNQFQSLNDFNQQPASLSNDTNYDSMSPFGGGLSDQTNQSDQNMRNASATETGTHPLESLPHVYLDSVLNQTDNASEVEENRILSAIVDEDTVNTTTIGTDNNQQNNANID